jgi:hypothetical protein
MKVDFPQPESAATPMMMGFSPSFKAMLRLEEEAGARKLAGMKAEGAKPWTETAARAVMDKKSFMIANYIFYCEPFRQRHESQYREADDVRVQDFGKGTRTRFAPVERVHVCM